MISEYPIVIPGQRFSTGTKSRSVHIAEEKIKAAKGKGRPKRQRC